MNEHRWDAEKIELMELANTWKRRAEEAEAKVHDLLRRQDEMATQIEEMRLHSLPIEGNIYLTLDVERLR